MAKDQDATNTLHGFNISHLGKRKIIFKMQFLGDMLVPFEINFEINFEMHTQSSKNTGFR